MAAVHPPSSAASYVRALVPKRADPPTSAPAQSPFPSLELRGLATDPARLRRYREVCGFADDGQLPATFPHLAAFPLAMELMTRRSFPVPVLGLIHITNEVTQTHPIAADSRLDYRVWVEPPREHPKGVAFDVRSEVRDSIASKPIWSSVSTYLRRRSSPATPHVPAHIPAQVAPAATSDTRLWRLPASLGRQYASVSGDRNPIHLHPLTARLFGFPHAIAHGMWTKARCLAALSSESGACARGLPDSFRVRVDFHSPVPLPTQLAFTAWHSESDQCFAVRSPDGRRDHLLGRLTPR
jgi:acyl dehydratase